MMVRGIALQAFFLFYAVVALAFPAGVAAWSTNTKEVRPFTRQERNTNAMYKYKSSRIPPQQAQQILTSQKMLKNPGNPSTESPRKKSLKLSNSVLASCDTLPSFQTAHGLLSPEIVMRLEDHSSEGRRSDALNIFLETYRQNGPLSCLPMLSDPEILPHLTQAMRDIAC